MSVIKKIEAILYTSGEPVKRSSLVKHVGCSNNELEDAISELKERKENDGVVVFDDGTSISLRTNPEIEDSIEELRKKDIERPLSRAARETLSVIAYIGPVTKHDLDFLRGVNTQFILRRLLMRGLVRELKDGSKREFSITDEFLAHMKITEVSQLSDYSDIRQKLLDGISSIRDRLFETNENEENQ